MRMRACSTQWIAILYRVPPEISVRNSIPRLVRLPSKSGGISIDGSRWVSCRQRFLLPVPVLSKLFRGLMLDKLLAAPATGKLQFFAGHAYLAERKALATYLAPLRRANPASPAFRC